MIVTGDSGICNTGETLGLVAIWFFFNFSLLFKSRTSHQAAFVSLGALAWVYLGVFGHCPSIVWGHLGAAVGTAETVGAGTGKAVGSGIGNAVGSPGKTVGAGTG